MVARTLVALAVASGLLLTGCKDGDRPEADPSQPPATSQPTGSTSDSPSTDGTGVEPASGPVVEGDVFSFHLPAETEWDLGRGGFSATAYDEEFNPFDVATSAIRLQAGESGEDLDADYESRIVGGPHEVTRAENRVVGGVEGWVAQGVDGDQLIYVFGALHERVSFSITFSFPKKDPRTLGWIESTLASIQWK